MLIKNATVITWEQPNRILENYAIKIESDLIQDVGPSNDILARYPESNHIDARGMYLMPGNICAHTHFYGAFSRGLAIPGKPPSDFPEILSKLWWPLDKSLTHQDIRLSALTCIVEAIRHGTTTLIDHHASPNSIDGSLDVIADAVKEAGVRTVLCYEVTDRDGPKKAKEGINENIRFINMISTGGNQPKTIRATFGLHASLTLSDATLDACRSSAPEGYGFHIHAAESIADQYDSLEKSEMRVVERLHKHGILGPRSIIAHAVHVDAKEIDILKETNTWVTHQPRSNMNNAVGVAPVESMLRKGIRVALGNDGFSNAMWEEWKAAYLVQKVWHHDPRRMSGYDVMQMAIYNNADLASQFFSEAPLGSISPGAYADLILVDYHPPTPLIPENLPWHIIFGFHESMIRTTIVGGKVLMKDGELVTLDEEEIAYKSRKIAPQVWNRYRENSNGQ